LTALLVLIVLTVYLPSPAQPLTPIAPAPSAAAIARADSLRADSVATAKAAARDTTMVVMHRFNHRQQIITGGAIMACMAGIMVVMNNYNPRVPQ
jgi:hypothetical protein